MLACPPAVRDSVGAYTECRPVGVASQGITDRHVTTLYGLY